MYLFYDTVVLPFSEIVINQFPVWETARHHAPLTACFNQIENGIENIPQRMFSLAVVV